MYYRTCPSVTVGDTMESSNPDSQSHARPRLLYRCERLAGHPISEDAAVGETGLTPDAVADNDPMRVSRRGYSKPRMALMCWQLVKSSLSGTW